MEEKLIERRLDAAEAKLLDITSGAMAFRMFMKWHIPIFFVIAIGSGILIPWPGAWISGNVPYSGKFLIGAIFLCSGLRLKVDDIVLAFKCLVGSMWGIVLILALTPLLSLALAHLRVAKLLWPAML
jgi:predicted Na+-dependent transporter